jgi:glucosamine-6-phosphate isomerase
MQIQIFDNYSALSQQLAERILEIVKTNRDTVLCLAAGDTPKLAYRLIAEKAKAERIDFTKCTFIGLDEWVGIPPENEGSCHFFLNNNLFKPLSISSSQVHLFNALSGDLHAECRKMDAVISKTEGIDCMVVGIGMNGHIGFNEPGVSFDLTAHVIHLDDNTRAVGQKYFSEKTVLDKGITLGFQHLLLAKEARLIANGSKKAVILKKAIEEPMHSGVPASIMQSHSNGFIMIDKEAASLLQPATFSAKQKNGHDSKW